MDFASGLYVASFTPVQENGSLNPDAIAPMAERLIANGVSGAFVLGTTGECYSFTVEERKAIAERWIATKSEKFKVLIHIGHHCQAEAIELARHAADKGADGIALMAPSYYRPASLEQLLEWCRPVAAAASGIDFYYYDIPRMTNLTIPASSFMKLAANEIPNLRGIKFSSADGAALQTILAVDADRFEVLYGCDECLLGGIAFGVHGAIGSTYNYAAPHYLAIIDAFRKGDFATARALQQQIIDMVDQFNQWGGGIRVGKTLMGLLGMDCGPVRPPFIAVSKAEQDEIRRWKDSSPIKFLKN